MHPLSAVRLVLLQLFITCFSFAQVLHPGPRGQVGSQLGPRTINPQQAQGPPQTVKGIVVNGAGGEPVPHAMVDLSGTTQLYQFSDDTGRFEFSDVPSGSVFISAQKPGFLDSRMATGNPYGMQNSMVNVKPGMEEVRVKLVPASRIEGRIVNADGEPLHGVYIQAIYEQIVNGRKRQMPRGGASTDGAGQFAMEDLPPGRYYLHTSPRALFPGLQASLQGRQAPSNVSVIQGYPAQYYSNATDLASAEVIDLKPGQDAHADFTLRVKPSFRVSGTVVGATNSTFVSVQDASGQQGASTGSRVDPKTGQFTIPAMFEGSWIIVFQSRNRQDERYAAQTVQITNSDVANLTVQLQPISPIPVEVDQPDPAASAANQPPQGTVVNPGIPFQLRLVPRDTGTRPEAYAARQGQDQSFSIPNAVPGKYQVVVNSFGSQCVASVLSGETDLTRTDYTVPEGSDPPPIRVTLRNDCGIVSGTVHTNSGNNAGMVLLISDSSSIEAKMTPVAPDGSFRFSSLSPGEYRVYAVSNLNNLEYANPEAFRGLSGQDVHLDPNQNATVLLEMIARGDS